MQTLLHIGGMLLMGVGAVAILLIIAFFAALADNKFWTLEK